MKKEAKTFANEIKVFWFFFSKKNPSFLSPCTPTLCCVEFSSSHEALISATQHDATAALRLVQEAGARLIYTGIALDVLTIAGFFIFPSIFLRWMAVVGGGALILGGFWLRQV